MKLIFILPISYNFLSLHLCFFLYLIELHKEKKVYIFHYFGFVFVFSTIEFMLIWMLSCWNYFWVFLKKMINWWFFHVPYWLFVGYNPWHLKLEIISSKLFSFVYSICSIIPILEISLTLFFFNFFQSLMTSMMSKLVL